MNGAREGPVFHGNSVVYGKIGASYRTAGKGERRAAGIDIMPILKCNRQDWTRYASWNAATSLAL
jgi:hypothetical protein